ncbi:MAG: type II secretion system F family protein [Vulcanimicrobiota bacterium]
MNAQGFRYTAVTRQSQVVESFITFPAFFPSGLAESLARFVLYLSYDQVQKMAPDARLGYRGNPGELMVYTRQLASMVKAGIPVHRAIYFISESDVTPTAEALGELAHLLETGHSLSHGTACLPGVFDPIFRGYARVAETSSSLPEALGMLAQHMEERVWLRQRVRGALIYPAFLMLGALILASVLVFGIVPMMTPTLTELGVPLPLLTRIVVAIAENGSRPPVILAVLLLVGLVAGFFSFVFGPTGRYSRSRRRVDAIILELPVFGPLARRICSSSILSALGLSLRVGVNLAKAVKDAETVVGNVIIVERMRASRKALEEGHSFGDALLTHDVLPRGDCLVLECGAEAGHLEETVDILARSATDEVDNQLDTMTSLLEPIVLVLMSVVVATVALATFLPWISLIQTLF